MQVSLNTLNNIGFQGKTKIIKQHMPNCHCRQCELDAYVGRSQSANEVNSKSFIETMKAQMRLNAKIRMAKQDAKEAYQLAQEAKIEAAKVYSMADWNSWFASGQIEVAKKMRDEVKEVYSKGEENGFEDYTDEKTKMEIKFKKDEDGKVTSIDEISHGKLYRRTEFSKNGDRKRVLITMPEPYNDVSSIYDFQHSYITVKNGYKKSENGIETSNSIIKTYGEDSVIYLDLDCQADEYSSKAAQKYSFKNNKLVSYKENVHDWEGIDIVYKDVIYNTTIAKSFKFDENGALAEYEAGISSSNTKERESEVVKYSNGEVDEVVIDGEDFFTFKNGEMVKTERILKSYEFMKDAHEILEFQDGKLSSHSFYVV
ncbi:MAG: hypothetical protein IJ003_03405 [Candidatus Gastranaerophilales bacterium]|nr:hypothetical protein [Candidatus Gastranaerophilales bacterium]